MASSRVRYKATNINTGGVYIGNARELVAKLHVARQTVYNYSITGLPYNGTWVFEKVGAEPGNNDTYNVQKSILEEWDQFVTAVRRCKT